MEDKNKNLLHFLKNLIMYTAIFVGAYFLYNANNTNAQNVPHTDFSFVYAQF
jgi:hypothetical protein